MILGWVVWETIVRLNVFKLICDVHCEQVCLDYVRDCEEKCMHVIQIIPVYLKSWWKLKDMKTKIWDDVHRCCFHSSKCSCLMFSLFFRYFITNAFDLVKRFFKSSSCPHELFLLSRSSDDVLISTNGFISIRDVFCFDYMKLSMSSKILFASGSCPFPRQILLMYMTLLMFFSRFCPLVVLLLSFAIMKFFLSDLLW